MYVVFFMYFKGTLILICCPWDTFWNNFFHLWLENTSDCSKQQNQHSWLFDPLGPSMSSGVLLDSQSQQVTGKPEKVWFHHQKSVLGKDLFATLLCGYNRKLIAQGQQENNQIFAPVLLPIQQGKSSTHSFSHYHSSLACNRSTEIKFASKLISMEAFSFSSQFPSVRWKPCIKKKPTLRHSSRGKRKRQVHWLGSGIREKSLNRPGREATGGQKEEMYKKKILNAHRMFNLISGNW